MMEYDFNEFFKTGKLFDLIKMYGISIVDKLGNPAEVEGYGKQG